MNRMKMAILSITTMMILGMIACKKDQVDTTPKGESVTSLDNFVSSQRAAQTQKFTVDAGQTQTITGSKGTKITMYANSFTLNGSAVTGSVDVKLIEAYEKNDMILLGMNTMGKDLWGNKGAMESAGEYYFEASQNGQALDISWPWPQLSTPAFSSNDFNGNMMPFVLEMDTSVATDSVWVPIDSFMNNCADSIQINAGQSTYCFNFGNNSSWINCDYFYSWGTTLTGLEVTLPAAYGNANTSISLSFDGLNMLTGLSGNASTGTFSLGASYQAPVGQAVNLVIVSEQNGVLEYAIKPFVLTAGHMITIPQSDIVPTTAANLQTQLSNLP